MTISKNRKRFIDELFSKVKECKLYTLDNHFGGEVVNLQMAKDELFANSWPKLSQDEENKLTIHIHSNRWFYLYL